MARVEVYGLAARALARRFTVDVAALAGAQVCLPDESHHVSLDGSGMHREGTNRGDATKGLGLTHTWRDQLRCGVWSWAFAARCVMSDWRSARAPDGSRAAHRSAGQLTMAVRLALPRASSDNDSGISLVLPMVPHHHAVATTSVVCMRPLLAAQPASPSASAIASSRESAWPAA
jgi:hypothetical protein